MEARALPPHLGQRGRARQRHRPRRARPAVPAATAAAVAPLAAPLPVAAVRRHRDPLAPVRRLPRHGHRHRRRAPVRPPERLGPGRVRARQAGVLHPRVRSAAIFPLARHGTAVLRAGLGGRRRAAGTGVPDGARGRGSGVPAAGRKRKPDGDAVGDPSAADHGGLRPRQPGARLADRRAELPGRAPPVPAYLARALPAGRPRGGGHLPRVRRELPRTPHVWRGHRFALPPAAAAGQTSNRQRPRTDPA